MLDAGRRGRDCGQVTVEGQLVGVEHGLHGPVADGMGGDPPASPGQRRDPAGKAGGTGKQDARSRRASAKSAHTAQVRGTSQPSA